MSSLCDTQIIAQGDAFGKEKKRAMHCRPFHINVKVSVAVKFIDNQTKATQVSQYELTLHKDSNWKIIN